MKMSESSAPVRLVEEAIKLRKEKEEFIEWIIKEERQILKDKEDGTSYLSPDEEWGMLEMIRQVKSKLGG